MGGLYSRKSKIVNIRKKMVLYQNAKPCCVVFVSKTLRSVSGKSRFRETLHKAFTQKRAMLKI